MELVLTVTSGGVVDDEALGLKLFVVGGQLEDVKVFLKLDLSPLLVEGLIEVEGVVVVEACVYEPYGLEEHLAYL